jgi:hypothetical protein
MRFSSLITAVDAHACAPPAFSARAAVVAGSIASLLPLIACWPQFRSLFFFGDDWELLDGAAHLGLGRWLVEPFGGEGVLPLFKLLWLDAVRLTGGSYFGMILLLWATHMAICLLFGWLLARFCLAPAAILFALLTFGLSWTNLETLGWSMQWCSQLAIVLFLAAWHFLLGNSRPIYRGMACFLCLTASALCSTRGIISGLVLAIFVLTRNRGRERLRLFILCLLPTVISAAVMWLFVPRHSVSPGAAFIYASEYLILNPLLRPLPFLRDYFGAIALPICGVLKTALFVWAFRKARPAVRPLLWTLIALDLIVAVSLGYGRWATGVATTTSSRYQYIPLLCFGPMAGILIMQLKSRVRIALMLLCSWGVAHPWKRHAEQWATGRGTVLRAAIAEDGLTEHFDPSAVSAGRARSLARIYNLH